MRRPLGRKLLTLSTCLAAVTLLTHLVLFGLASAGWDPVVFRPSGTASGSRAHGMPAFSWVGLSIWLGVLGIHALASNVVAARLLHLSRPANPSFIGYLLGASACLAAVVHPTFLLTVLPAQTRQSLIAVVESSLPPLEEIYFHWGLSKWWAAIFVVHLLLTLAAVQILVRRSR